MTNHAIERVSRISYSPVTGYWVHANAGALASVGLTCNIVSNIVGISGHSERKRPCSRIINGKPNIPCRHATNVPTFWKINVLCVALGSLPQTSLRTQCRLATRKLPFWCVQLGHSGLYSSSQNVWRGARGDPKMDYHRNKPKKFGWVTKATGSWSTIS